jgi:hypothetical protein
MPWSAKAQTKDLQYFCTVEAMGGISNDNASKVWEGTSFRPRGKFIMRLHLEASRQMKEMPSQRIDEYSVFVTEAGSNKSEKCSAPGKETVDVYDIPSPRWVVCSFSFYEIKVNLTNNRFVKAFLFGYFNGTDDTPSVAGGTCTKIQ